MLILEKNYKMQAQMFHQNIVTRNNIIKIIY